MNGPLFKQIKASAGSGKTYALTLAFLDLVAGSGREAAPPVCARKPGRAYDWGEILAATFTNRAATEMKQRVVGALKSRALGLDSDGPGRALKPGQARAMLMRVLTRLGRLNVRTIDSLLATILRIFALPFGISPEFEMVFDRAELLEPVFDRYIGRIESGEQDPAPLEKALDSLITRESVRGFWVMDAVRARLFDILASPAVLGGEVCADQAALAAMLASSLAETKEAVRNVQALLETGHLKANANFLKAMNKCLACGLFDPPPESAFFRKTEIAECLAKKDKGKTGKAEQDAYENLQAALARRTREQAVLASAWSLAPVVVLARELLGRALDMQREKGVVLGDHLCAHVRGLLDGESAVPEAFCRLGARLRHMLVDEFQDTSADQWAAMEPLALECLSQGGGVTYVGDVKQAIYGWRGGDSGLFDSVAEPPGPADLARPVREDLPANWRSSEEVVGFFNAVFPRLADTGTARTLAEAVMADAPEACKLDFVEDLARVYGDAAQEIPAEREAAGGYVRFSSLAGGLAGEVLDETAEALVDLLANDLLTRRPPGDVAVLVRSNDQAARVCEALVEAGIPVITENSLELAAHPLVNGLAAFLRFVDYPLDNLHFFELATNAEVFPGAAGLDPDTVFDWAATVESGPLYTAFRRDFPEVWQRVVEPYFRKSGLMSPYDLAYEMVRGLKVVERNPGHELYARRFLEVVHLAEENGLATLSAFLEFWDTRAGEEKVPLPEYADAVRIMTIHKAKGLEFPVAVVPFHHFRARVRGDARIQEVGGKKVAAPLTVAVGEPYWRDFAKEVHEQLNLLYVAWTRPREELYGFVPEALRGQASPALEAARLLLGESFEDTGTYERGIRPGPGKLRLAASGEPEAPAVEPVEAAALMDWLPRLRVYRNTLEDLRWDERMRGEVVHRAMQWLRRTGDPEADARLALDAALPRGGLFADRRGEMAAWLGERLKTLYAHPELALCLKRGLPEAGFVDADGAFMRADLLYKEGRDLLVVEYKTGREDPEHAAQVRRYLRAASAGSDVRARGFVVYLETGLIKAVEPGGRP